MKYLTLLLLVCMCSCKERPSALPYFNSPDFTPEWLTATAAKKPMHTIPSFSFVDQDGAVVNNATTRNKIYIVDFFFTRCTGICPKMTSNMNKVATAFHGDSTVMMLSHSVTPEFDSIPVLKKYATLRNITNNNWRLLTGNKEAIYNIARNGYFIEKNPGYNKDTSEFLHTENFVLVDQQQHIRGIYNGTLEYDVDQLIRHIRMLQKQRD
jgi:protein SCO1